MAKLSPSRRIAGLFLDPNRYLVSRLHVGDVHPVDMRLLWLAGLQPGETEPQLLRATPFLRGDAGQQCGEDTLLNSASAQPLTIPERQKRDHGRSPCGPQIPTTSGKRHPLREALLVSFILLSAPLC